MENMLNAIKTKEQRENLYCPPFCGLRIYQLCNDTQNSKCNRSQAINLSFTFITSTRNCLPP